MKIDIGKLFRRKKVKPTLDVIETDYHKITLDQLQHDLATSISDGLDESKAAQLLAKNGFNRISQKSKNPIFKLVGYLFTGFCGLIWVAAIICILAWRPIGNPPDPTNLGLGVLLIFVILLQASFSAFQDWSSSQVMKSIKNMMPSSATVVRNGKEKKIAVEELVVGDVVCLLYGQKVPADVRITESRDLKFDKSMLTGESEAIEGTVECTDDKYVESKNIGYMTTLVTNGQGKGVVIFVGDNTIMGKIAGLTSQTVDQETHLQKELKRFVFIIGCLAVTMAIIVIIVWAAWLRVQYPNYINIPSLMVNTISVMIAFIPEGLPICVTLSLLIIAKRMAKSRVLVKNLSVIETLSVVNVIASDKTGTLTQNKMFVARAAAGLDELTVAELDAQSASTTAATRSRAWLQLIASSGLCNNAKFDDDKPMLMVNQKLDATTADVKVDVKQRKANGDATDIALLKFATEYGRMDELEQNYTVLSEIPFNSKNKWMMKICRSSDGLFDAEGAAQATGECDVVLLKGAPDYLLKKSTSIVNSDGTARKLETPDVNAIIKLQNEWCVLGQRVLIICKKMCNFVQLGSRCGTIAQLENYINESNDFCIVGLVGIIDPPREGISDVISQCKAAGIRVFMVTGDYALTAAAIALQIGIFTQSQFDTIDTLQAYDGSEAAPTTANNNNNNNNRRSLVVIDKPKRSLLLTGGDLVNFKADDWRKVTKYDEVVFARTTPEQKLTVVKEFQRDGFTVGVTGDGVNDAPALKCADIGIAMGSGSEVAMEAAQLVLLDNNFSAILIAIRNGRLVFKNLRKVILYLLPGGCMAELVPVLMSIFLGVPQNLSSFQMIIVSLFTDISPSLSLMMEKEEYDLLKQPPRAKSDHLVDWKFMIQAYFFLGTMVAFFSQTMFFIYMQTVANLMPGQILLSFGNFLTPPDATSNSSAIDPQTTTTTTTTNYALNQENFYVGQTVTFVSLVLLQIFGNLLSTKSHIRSFFQQVPWKKSTRNLWVYAAELVSTGIFLVIVFVPWFHDLFNTRAIPVGFLFLPLCFCLIIVLLDETRKLFARNKIFYFHKFAW